MAFEDIYRGYVLIDSSALIALIDSRDQNHDFSALALEELKKDVNVRLFICNLTIYETFTRLRYDVGWDAARGVWLTITNTMRASRIEFPGALEEKTKDILDMYRVHKLSFHDAGCAAVMLKNKIGRVFSFDSHFDLSGFERFPG